MLPPMAVSGGPCPNCGASVEFRAGASMTVVCEFCKQVVARTDRGLAGLGTVADMAPTEHGLALRDRGSYGGARFEVVGRLVLRHPAGGSWEEYAVAFEDGRSAWIATAMGRWFLTGPVPVRVMRSWESLGPGHSLPLDGYGMFTVSERNEAPFECAQGELPFAARVGDVLRFVDLAGADGRVATVHYLREGGAHAVFMGVEVQRAQLAIESAAGERRGAAVATQNLQCPNCGGGLPARADPNSQRVVCPYCSALSDLAAHEVIARQEQVRASLPIPLGARGTLSGVAWTAIGYVERATWFDNERFTWCEYLLYSADSGYRWLIFDEGNWLFATPVSAGDVAVAPTGSHATFQGATYTSRNTGSASVVRVLGEFYWKVAVGETVQTQDFVCGSGVLSREGDAAEVQWTYSTPIPGDTLFRAFGLPPPARMSPPAATWSGDGNFVASPSWNTWVVLGVIVFMIFCCFVTFSSGGSSTSGYNGGYSGGHGGVTFGGFGGK